MVFYIGQRVICVNVTPRRDGLHPRYASTAIPVLGMVYTIRDIFDARPFGHDDFGLLLEEVVNPVRRYISQGGPVTIEQFWLAYRFRPLRRTNIDVFLRMLEPTPIVELIGWASAPREIIARGPRNAVEPYRRVAPACPERFRRFCRVAAAFSIPTS